MHVDMSGNARAGCASDIHPEIESGSAVALPADSFARVRVKSIISVATASSASSSSGDMRVRRDHQMSARVGEQIQQDEIQARRDEESDSRSIVIFLRLLRRRCSAVVGSAVLTYRYRHGLQRRSILNWDSGCRNRRQAADHVRLFLCVRLIDQIFQFFARLEIGDALGRHFDPGARSSDSGRHAAAAGGCGNCRIPRISILSPVRSARTMLSKIASTITSESLRVISTTRETSSIRSAFVNVRDPPVGTQPH